MIMELSIAMEDGKMGTEKGAAQRCVALPMPHLRKLRLNKLNGG